MALVRRGKLKGFFRPKYDGNSVLNLLSSIIRSRGGRSPHLELKALPARDLRPARKIVYLLVDGLGAYQLKKYLKRGRGKSFFAVHPHRVISTVFPATTASAATTFATGASPTEHGVLGWFQNLPDLGLVSTILKTETRTKTPAVDSDFDLTAYLKVPSYIRAVRVRKVFMAPPEVKESRFSTAVGGWNVRRGFTRLGGVVKRIAEFAHAPGRALAYAYWPGLDDSCHKNGCFHRKTLNHFDEIDRTLERAVDLLRGTDTVLIVVADHGLIDVPDRNRIDLAKVRGFYDCLAMLPSGDTRHVSCFVRPRRERKFLELVRGKLSRACVPVDEKELLELGAYGPGRAHPSLSGRIGDYVLLARPGYAFSFPPSGIEPHNPPSVAYHGGMSPQEMEVPLYVVRP